MDEFEPGDTTSNPKTQLRTRRHDLVPRTHGRSGASEPERLRHWSHGTAGCTVRYADQTIAVGTRVDAARERASLGEISDAMEAAFGRYDTMPKPVAGIYGAAYAGDSPILYYNATGYMGN